MSNLDITKVTTQDMHTGMTSYSPESKTLDSPGIKETRYNNDEYDDNLSYYVEVPELKRAIDTYATWVLGQGFTCDTNTKIILDDIRGWGEDTFLSIIWNLLVQKKYHGDSYAEIVRDEDGELLNLKVLNPKNVSTVVGEDMLIKEYSYRIAKGKEIKFKPKEILHFCNDRIGDEIHGRSVVHSIKWVINAKKRAANDLDRIIHNSTVRILFIAEDNQARLSNIMSNYKTAIDKGDLIVLPVKPGDEAQFQDLAVPPIEAFLKWIDYLDNYFYLTIGVPKSVVGGTQDTTEASSKVGMVSFDPTYIREITDIQNDLWNQLILKINFTGQKSMMDNMQTDQSKNTGQTKMELQGSQ